MGYSDFNSYLKNTFGKKVYKIALSTPFSCPNRDGKVGVGGCIFCSDSGSGNFAADSSCSVSEQILEAKKRVWNKIKGKDCGYIAYFQSFSSTYGDVAIQRKLFFEAISDPEVVALSVATRPDCLPEEVLDLLEELSKIKPVWVELGFQTAKESTARLIRRGYENAVFSEAVENLKSRGLSVIVHLILGLPEEDHRDEIQSVRFVCAHPIDGIKFHLLHVLRGTDLAKMPYEPLSFSDYIDRVCDLLRYVPENVIIHRLTGDGDKKELIAPLWSADKKRVLNAISKKIREENITQGEKVLQNF
jgi:radical SAM protein (TIGR01212 family)